MMVYDYQTILLKQNYLVFVIYAFLLNIQYQILYLVESKNSFKLNISY